MKKVRELPWRAIQDSLNTSGYANIENFLSHNECEVLKSLYMKNSIYRKTVVMERHRFGRGEYRYFNYPLPEPIEKIRTSIYPHLVPIANLWMKVLKRDIEYPLKHRQFIETCHQQKQLQPTPLILNYSKGGFNTLHQDLYGQMYFPFQMVIFLSDYGSEYTGGEFVLTEQISRSQSKAIVLKPRKGDALIFSTAHRPIHGKRGYYKANLRHGVSEVTEGKRYTMGIIFHDALS